MHKVKQELHEHPLLAASAARALRTHAADPQLTDSIPIAMALVQMGIQQDDAIQFVWDAVSAAGKAAENRARKTRNLAYLFVVVTVAVVSIPALDSFGAKVVIGLLGLAVSGMAWQSFRSATKEAQHFAVQLRQLSQVSANNLDLHADSARARAIVLMIKQFCL